MLAEIRNDLEALGPIVIIDTEYNVKGYHLDVEVGPEQVVAAAEAILKHGCFLESITGIDWLGKSPTGNAPKKEAEGDSESGEGGEASRPGEEATGDLLEVVYDFNFTGGVLCRVMVTLLFCAACRVVGVVFCPSKLCSNSKNMCTIGHRKTRSYSRPNSYFLSISKA